MALNIPKIFPLCDNAVNSGVQIAVFLFGALSLAVPGGYSYGPVILFCVSLTVFWRPDYWTAMPREVKILGLIFIFYFLVQAISIWSDGGKLRELDRPSRALMAAFILPLLSKYPARQSTLMFGFACGACISGTIAIYDKLYLDMDRAFGDGMPIQSGNISMTLGLFCLCAYFWYKNKQNTKLALLMLFACAMGILGSFLSGTRGGWILLPLIVLSIIIHFKDSICRMDKFAAAFFGLGLLGLVAIPQTGVLGRISVAHSEIVQFVDGGNKNTSLGIRFQLWSSAWNAFLDKPFFGWGNNGIRQSYAEQFATGKMTKFIYDLKYHAHNQFLDEMAKRGVIGLLALFCVYIYPLFLYRRHRASNSLAYILIAVAALTLIDYSLSQAFINHNSGIVFFFACFAILIASLSAQNEEREF